MARRAKPLEPPGPELNARASFVFLAMGRRVRVRVWDRGQPLEGLITRIENTHQQRQDGGSTLILHLGPRTAVHLDDVTGLERA